MNFKPHYKISMAISVAVSVLVLAVAADVRAANPATSAKTANATPDKTSIKAPGTVSAKKTIENDRATATKACESFVQDFYDWYIPEMTNNVPAPVSERVLKVKARSFSAELIRMLKADLEESKKVPDEIVGLDFDPFVNSQETPNHFVTGKCTVTPSAAGNKYQVEVFDTTDFANRKNLTGKKKLAPQVTPELMYKSGQWYFTNFLYPSAKIKGNESLLSILKILQDNRRKAGIQSHK